ncbi:MULTISPECIES: arsenate reductase family protein [unclassified Synechococcus]|uniref:arsenate reductase family protein n=1 Tax=unclassified Synechococcus TaxID=2626047 RepID=UPI00103ACFF3|nr:MULTISPECIES: arsenate reductase family protein [unclassified Synechococcus]QNG26234.1 arsenate reductase family protein [Synechococcus sp. HK01-R]TCD56403.1 ArsC family transcriptional regulator [Synechococcus sp. BS55D]
MAGLQIWSYSKCSTCRKALAWLDQRGIAYECVDITVNPPERDRLVRAFQHFGRLQPLFNTSGQSYRALGAAAVKAMTPEQALDALAADGKLIKRPFLESGDGAFLVGFNEAVWSETFQG